MSIFVVATPFRHRDLKVFHIFSYHGASITVQCRVVEQLKHYCVPSSVFLVKTVEKFFFKPEPSFAICLYSTMHCMPCQYSIVKIKICFRTWTSSWERDDIPLLWTAYSGYRKQSGTNQKQFLRGTTFRCKMFWQLTRINQWNFHGSCWVFVQTNWCLATQQLRLIGKIHVSCLLAQQLMGWLFHNWLDYYSIDVGLTNINWFDLLFWVGNRCSRQLSGWLAIWMLIGWLFKC